VDGSGERGAVIIHVALALLALTALSTFVVDYGVMWAARRQAQNAADAGALAGAVSMGFVDQNDQALARTSAINTALQNPIWGAPPDITPADVTFPVCPPGAPGAGTNSCIRVDVFRNQRGGGNPLPTFFGNLVGITNQGVRATATAEVRFGGTSNCVKPWAMPDKWDETYNDVGPPGWDPSDTFERYEPNGPNQGQLLSPNPDTYQPPGAGPYGPNGTGFTREGASLGGSDYGLQIVLKHGNPQQAIAPGWFFPVVINPDEGPGGDNYRENIATCDPTAIGPGSVLSVEPGNMVGPTSQGVADLIAQDPGAYWGGNGVQGGCMAAGTCALSPRVVAIPVFNPDTYDAGRASGRIDIYIEKVVGFFIEGMQGNDVIGRLMTYPSEPSLGTDLPPGASFVVQILLVR
jgi:hypothetical protein